MPALCSQQRQQCIVKSFLPSLLCDSLCRAASPVILVYSGALPVLSPPHWVLGKRGMLQLGQW